MELKIGDKIKQIPHANNDKLPFTAVVKSIVPCNPENPIEEHGTVKIEILETGTLWRWLQIGMIENLNHYNIERIVEIFNKGAIK